MKKKLLGVLLSVVLASSLIIGCQSQKEETQAPAQEETKEPEKEAQEQTEVQEPAKDDETATYADLTLTDAEKESVKGMTIGVSYCLLSAPAVKVFAQGIQAEAQELGITLVELDGNFDATTQANQMSELIAQGVDAIVLNPSDGTSLVAAAKEAHDVGIPVVTGAMNIDASGAGYIETFVGPDDEDAGFCGGEAMVEHLKDGGKVAVIEGTAGSSAQVNRTAGFERALEGSNLEVVAKISADYDEATAMNTMQDLLTRYPDLAGVFCHDDTMASGAAQALKELGYTGGEVIIVGYGGSAAGAKLIEEGYMVASAVQPLVEEGRGCIKALVKALNGEELNGWYKDVIVPLDADTLKTYDKSLLW